MTDEDYGYNADSAASLIHEGANLSQLMKIFGMDKRDIVEAITGKVEPSGKRHKAALYKIKDVAPYLIVPPYSLDEFIEKMITAPKLPLMVRKEFWTAMRSRQQYEIAAAELWPTQDVVETLNEVFISVRQSMLISREIVERETELTSKQRKIITQLIDSCLERVYATITERFPTTAEERAPTQQSGLHEVTATQDNEDL
jgi:hypothetical protein